MPVEIQDVEVVAQQPPVAGAAAPQPQQQTPTPPHPELALEIERAARLGRSRDHRLKAD